VVPDSVRRIPIWRSLARRTWLARSWARPTSSADITRADLRPINNLNEALRGIVLNAKPSRDYLNVQALLASAGNEA
jgi:hypothetical protein